MFVLSAIRCTLHATRDAIHNTIYEIWWGTARVVPHQIGCCRNLVLDKDFRPAGLSFEHLNFGNLNLFSLPQNVVFRGI